jgi:hypothetical protein
MNEAFVRQNTSGGNWLNVILGIWIVLSPFVLGFSNRTALMWNNVATGGAIFLLALGRSRTRRVPPGLVVLLGLWLIVSPFVLGASRQVAELNNIVLGIIVALIALGRQKRNVHPATAR